MNKLTIWKHPISLEIDSIIPMKKGAKILAIQTQKGKLAIWALVDPAAEIEYRHFQIKGTGWDPEPMDHCQYIGTAQTNDGDYVWHIFEVKK